MRSDSPWKLAAAPIGAMVCAAGVALAVVSVVNKGKRKERKRYLVCFGAKIDVRGVSAESQAKFGKLGLQDYVRLCKGWAAGMGAEVDFFPPLAAPQQCNDIDGLCAAIRAAPARGCAGILVNPGHFTLDAAAADAIGTALGDAALPSINTHYSASPIARACPVTHHTTGVVLGAKEHGMRLGLLALEAMSDTRSFTAHDV